MFKFFDIIVSFLEHIVNMVLSLFKIIVYVFGFIAQGFTYMFTCVAFLPEFLQAFLIVIVAYSVLITVLNKGE